MKRFDRWVLIFPILALVYFGTALLPNNTLFGTDYLGDAYWGRKFVKEYIQANGEFPQFNPYTNESVVDNTSGDLLLPTSILLHQALPVHSVQVWSYFLYMCFAGIFFYLFALRIGCKRWGAIFGATAYMFTGQIISLVYAGQDGKIVVSYLLPALLYFADIMFERRKWWWFVPCSVVVAFMLLSSHIQMVFYSLSVGLTYAIWKARKVRWWRGILFAAIIPIAGLCLAGIEYVPFLHHLPQSQRFGGQWSMANTSSWAMSPAETIGIAFPQIFGLLEKYNGANQFKLHSEYLGLIVCVFVIVGIVKNRKWFWLLVATLGCLLAWGMNTPFGNLTMLIPLYRKFRAVGMAFFIASFALCILAAYGFQAVKRWWLATGLIILSILDLWRIDKLFFHIIPSWDLERFRPETYAKVLEVPHVWNPYFWYGADLSLATTAILTLIFFLSNHKEDSECPQ